MKSEHKKKTALVLSGGGAKGAFQVGAEKYARGIKNYEWDVISGVSVGALNGAMLAMGKYQELFSVWYDISKDKVLTGGLNIWSILKMVLGAKSIYGNQPLWELIGEQIDIKRIKVDLTVGAVSLETGAYKRIKIGPSTSAGVKQAEFKKAILASTAIPIVWAPVDVSPANPSMVDGGLRNMSPIGDVLDKNPDEIVIIACTSTSEPVYAFENRNALDIGKHALEIAMNEIFVTDFHQFVRINRMVSDAKKQANLAIRKQGQQKVYKEYNFKLIEPHPDFPMGKTLDFNSKKYRELMEHGWERAKAALG